MEKVNQKMKKFNLRGVLTGLRSTVSTTQKQDFNIEETLKSEHFSLSKTNCHGFPFNPSCISCDPVQNLLAIGTKNGHIKILGKPGVEYNVRHEGGRGVIQLIFLINEGFLISIATDDQIHMWNLKQKKPFLIHSLKFQREKISACHLPLHSKWLYVGTERGNVQIVNLESFVLSGYIIHWNKAMDLMRLSHTGSVVHLSDNPMDPNKLLIGFASGSVVLWDLKSKTAELRFSCSESLKSVCWHQDGKQFICSHGDGSLTVWNLKQTQRPQSYMMPHAKLGKDGKPEACKPITKVDYRSVRNSEPFIIFTGGSLTTSSTPSLTVMHRNNMTVLEMENEVVDFLVLCSTPWNNDYQDPHSIVVLLKNDLVVVDLNTNSYPCFENPYPMDIHESPVTSCSYFADCPLDLVQSFYSVGSKRNRGGYSEREWPINGGDFKNNFCNYSEIIITGHADGSVKFWDSSGATLLMLYKLKTTKVFDTSKSKKLDEDEDENVLAIQLIHFCVDSRLLCLAGFTHVMLFKFAKSEASVECPTLDISIIYDVCDDNGTPDLELPVMFPAKSNHLPHQSGSIGSYGNIQSFNGKEAITTLKTRPGSRRWPPGYQPDLCCLLVWLENEPPPPVTSISINSKFGLLAFGDECGIAVVDIIQKTCLLSMGTPDLYGSLDPYSRAPRSPKLKSTQSAKVSTLDHLSQTPLSDECRSPTIEQHAKTNTTTTNSKFWFKKPAKTNKMLTPLTSFPTKSPAFKTYSCPNSKEQDGESFSLENEEKEEEVEEGEEDSENKKFIRFYVGQSENKEEKEKKKRISWLERGDGKEGCGDNMFGQKKLSQINTKNNNGMKETSENKKEEENIVSENERNNEEWGGGKESISSYDASLKQNSLESLEKVGDGDPYNKKRQNEEEQEEEDIDLYFKNYSTGKDLSGSSKGSLTSLKEKPNPPHQSKYQPQQLSKLTISKSLSMLRKMKRTRFAHKSFSEDMNLENEVLSKQPLEDDVIRNSSLADINKEVFDFEERKDDETLKRQNSKPHSLSRLVSGIFKGSGEDQRKSHVDILDLSDDTSSPQIKPLPHIACSNRGDNSFCRSHSSSTASLENINKESIVCLSFADVYNRKSDTNTSACLWLGTSLGTVLVVSITLPSDPEMRKREPLIISPSGTIFRLKGSIINISFLDSNANIIQPVSDSWKDSNSSGSSGSKEEKKNLYARQSPGFKSRISPSSSIEINVDKQFALICSEKQARVISLPSQTCTSKVKITETSCVAVAQVINFKESACLVCYVSNGHISVHSLPSLKPLMDVDYVSTPNIRVTKTISFSSCGFTIFMPTPTEIQKLTLSAEMGEYLKENASDLYVPCSIPEAPKQSFFKNLFGGPVAAVDREELFGESSGKPSKGMTKYTPGPGGITQEANLATSEIGRAKMAALERGEKLGDLEERTEKMKNEAELFAQSAHQLKMKYKDKKWYQF